MGQGETLVLNRGLGLIRVIVGGELKFRLGFS